MCRCVLSRVTVCAEPCDGAQEQGGADPPAGDQQTVTYMMTTAPQGQTSASASASAAAETDPLAQATRVSPATVRVLQCHWHGS